MTDERHRNTIAHDQAVWEHLVGSQTPSEYARVAALDGIGTIPEALADLEHADAWDELEEEQGRADLLASLARTLHYEAGMSEARFLSGADERQGFATAEALDPDPDGRNA